MAPGQVLRKKGTSSSQVGTGSGTEDVRLAWGGWTPEENCGLRPWRTCGWGNGRKVEARS